MTGSPPQGLGFIPRSRVYAFPTGNQNNIQNNTDIPVTLDNEKYDTNNDFNTATSTFTAPMAGYYLVIGSIAFFNIQANSFFSCKIFKNGALILRGDSLNGTFVSQTENPRCSGVLKLAAGDTLTLTALQITGVNTVNIASDSGSLTFLMVHQLSI